MTMRKRRLVETNFGAVHYWLQGDGEPLLVIHQSTQCAAEFDDFANIIADNFMVIAIDLPGHGCSDDPDHELSVDEHAEAVVHVLDDVSQNSVYVLGHHGGGMVAVALAATYPNRVRRLITTGAGIPASDIRERILNQPMSRDFPMDEDGEFLQRTWSIYRGMSTPGSTPDTWFKPFSVSLRARLRIYDLHRASMLFDYAAALSNIRQPTLMLKGEHDHLAGDIEAASQLVSDVKIASVPGCGAWQYAENPTATATLVMEFLSTNTDSE